MKRTQFRSKRFAKGIMGSFASLLTAFFLFSAESVFPDQPEAASLSLSTSKITMVAGVTVSSQIDIDDAENLAGCTFTLVYPRDVLELEGPGVQSDYFAIFQDQRADASPAEIDLWQYNCENAGKVMISGANAPGQFGESGAATLFTVDFRVVDTPPSGPFSIRLVQTELCNGPAGWGTDVNGNGVCDDGDVAEGAPVLLMAQQDQSSWQYSVLLDDFFTDPLAMLKIESVGDTDGDGLPDALENNCCTFFDDHDTDNDGLWDGVEDKNGNCVVEADETDPCDFDSDRDGICDGLEDVNHNGLADAGELDPRNSDSDGDGFDDKKEMDYGMDPLDPDSPHVICIGEFAQDSCHDWYANLGEWMAENRQNEDIENLIYIRFRKDNDHTVEELVIQEGLLVGLENGEIVLEPQVR